MSAAFCCCTCCDCCCCGLLGFVLLLLVLLLLLVVVGPWLAKFAASLAFAARSRICATSAFCFSTLSLLGPPFWAELEVEFGAGGL